MMAPTDRTSQAVLRTGFVGGKLWLTMKALSAVRTIRYAVSLSSRFDDPTSVVVPG
jgi:hypothetical protein